MSNYTKTVDFAAKDTLPSGDSGKIIKGTEFETEFDNISTAIATKADSAAPTFTGTSVFTNLDINGTVQADGAVTVGVDDTGYDVKFFGATAGKSLLWDESADTLIVTGDSTVSGTLGVTGEVEAATAHFGTGTGTAQTQADEVVVSGTSSTGLTIHSPDANNATLAFGSATDNDYAFVQGFYNSGSPFLRFSIQNSEKVKVTSTGIDVTGTVTADGLTVSTGVYNINTSGASLISSTGSVKIDIDSDNNANDNRFLITSDGNTKDRLEVKESGDISFYNAAGDSQALFWDASAESLGIGTTTVNADLHLGAASPHIDIGPSTGNRGKIGYNTNNVYIGSTSGTGEIHFKNNIGSTDAPNASGDTKMVITDSGVGIGTTTPQKLLDITENSSGESIPVVIANRDVTAGTGQKVTLGFGLSRNSGAFKPEAGTIEVGRESDWTASDANIDSYMAFSTYLNNAATEKMRIDASGNLLVGTTDTDTQNNNAGSIADNGFAYNIGSGGYLNVARYNGTVAYFNRTGPDGAIIDFRKDGATVGSIGSTSGSMYIQGNPAAGKSGLTFFGSYIEPRDDGSPADSAIDLGSSDNRFRDLYLSSGVVFGTTGGAVSSKTLDDYEEGTWTPTLYYQNATGVTRTYTEQTGHYTKIGNTVTVWCTLKGGTSNSGSYANDNIGISGLPFSVIGGNATAPVRQSGFAGTASVGTLCMLLTSSVALLSTPEDANNLADDLGAGATYTLTFSGSYETTE
jgi:hypothetical protein